MAKLWMKFSMRRPRHEYMQGRERQDLKSRRTLQGKENLLSVISSESAQAGGKFSALHK